MTEAERFNIVSAGSDASQISSLLGLVADALAAEPATSIASQAIDGIEKLADRLSENLLRLADPNA